MRHCAMLFFFSYRISPCFPDRLGQQCAEQADCNGSSFVSVTTAMMKHLSQKQLREGSIYFIYTPISQEGKSSKEVREGTQARQDPQGRS